MAVPAEQAALLAAVVAASDDDTPRLVYADWLEEHDDAEQAAFVRDSIALARAKPRARNRKALRERVRGAAGEHGDRWLAALVVGRPTATYDRGFPHRVTFGGVDEFLAAADPLFRLTPVRGLVIEGAGEGLTDTAAVRRLAKAPGLARLADLRLYELDQARPAAWRVLFRSPHLAGLTHLSLAGCGIYDAEAEELAAAPPLAGLTDLDLGYNSIGVGGAQAILDSPHLRRLKTLWLEHNFFGQEEGEDEVLEALDARLGDGLHVHDSPEDEEDED